MGGLPRVPEENEVNPVSTQTAITINWTFAESESRDETFSIVYGTSRTELNMASDSISSIMSQQSYSIPITFLQPGTRYYYQIHSTNRFTTRTDSIRDIKTMDASEFELINEQSYMWS